MSNSRMKQIYELSKENVELSKAEVIRLFDSGKYELYDELLIVEGKKGYERLAYTSRVFELLFVCDKKDIVDRVKGFDWEKVYDKNYCVRIHGDIGVSERKLGSLVWYKLKKPKVKLENSKTEVHFFVRGNKVVCGKLVWKNKERFIERKAHKLDVLYPAGLHPKLARGMINLSGADKSVYDPFCGAGGILIEGGLIGLKIKGYDINEKMIDASRKNLTGLKLKNFELKQMDSLKLKKKMDYIVTDLPYGKGTKNIKGDFYKKVFEMIEENLGKCAVIGMPSDVKFSRHLKRLRVVDEFSVFLHKGLSKMVVVLER